MVAMEMYFCVIQTALRSHRDELGGGVTAVHIAVVIFFVKLPTRTKTRYKFGVWGGMKSLNKLCITESLFQHIFHHWCLGFSFLRCLLSAVPVVFVL